MCYHPSCWRMARHRLVQTCVPYQTHKRPHFIQSVNRPAPSTLLERTAQTQPDFHLNGWAAGPCKLNTVKQTEQLRWHRSGIYRQRSIKLAMILGSQRIMKWDGKVISSI